MTQYIRYSTRQNPRDGFCFAVAMAPYVEISKQKANADGEGNASLFLL
jgi:hypothetical protein